MLVLRRLRGQSIIIGEKGEIIIKILKDENGVISIGITAPKSVPVDRSEIFDKKASHNDKKL